jgi:hypothetical protein
VYIGFVVHHVARKLLIGGVVVAGVTLATKAGRRLPRIGVAAMKGAGEAVFSEVKAQNWRS